MYPVKTVKKETRKEAGYAWSYDYHRVVKRFMSFPEITDFHAHAHP